MCQPLQAPFCAASNGSHPAFQCCSRDGLPNIADRLIPLIDALQQRFAADIALCQLWTLVDGQQWSSLSRQQLKNEVVAETHSNPHFVQDLSLQSFRTRCCTQGIRGSALGMVGKAWSSGALCVIQNAETLPHSFHPRTKLEGFHRVSQLVYVPIFDQLTCRGNNQGVQAVLEIMIHRHAEDAMIVANAITYIGAVLTCLQMSVSRPQQQQLYASSPFSNALPAAEKQWQSAAAQQAEQESFERHPAAQTEERVICAPGAQAGSWAVQPGQHQQPHKSRRCPSPTSPLDFPPAMTRRLSRTVSMMNVSLTGDMRMCEC